MDYAEFGRYLNQQRELRGVTREEVATLTRIPATVLAALEGGQVERLPARIFVLNYIRAYAQAIGLQPEEAVLRFEEVDPGGMAPGEQSVPKKRNPKLSRLVVPLFAFTAALVALGAITGRIHLFHR